MDSPTRAEIDLAAIRHNLAVIRRASSRPVMAVVKANAYGHGASRVSQCLQGAGVERFAVATLPEALQLRKAGLTARIQVFGVPLPGEIEAFSRHGLELTISTPELLKTVLAGDFALGTHLHIDTGMMRLGLPVDRTLEAVEALRKKPGVSLRGVLTHFASADLPGSGQTQDQLGRWRAVRSKLPADLEVHASSSGGVFTSPDVAGESDIVRAGIALYGLYDPATDVPAPGLRPAMRLVTRISRIESIAEGTPVSYGGRWRAPTDGRILTLAVGYADGLPRSLSSTGQVGLRNHLLPIAGTVCMDMAMVFVDDPAIAAQPGERVVLWGPGGPSVLDVARLANTIPYEIVCGVGARVDRVFAD